MQEMKKKFLIFSALIVLLVLIVFSMHHILLSPSPGLSQESSTLQPSIDNSTKPDNLAWVTFDNQKLFWDFLNEVVGLDTDNYTVDQFHETPQETTATMGVKSSISATLSNKQATINIVMNISDRKIRSYDLNVISGTLEGSSLKANDFLASSKNALNQYRILNQHRSSNSRADYCEDFVQLIPAAIQAEKVSVDNEKLLLTIDFANGVNSQVKYVEFSWYQKIEEFADPVLLVQAAFAKTGLLTFFSDGMGVYTVATTRVALSEQEAINLARSLIDEYANANGQTVKGIKAKLVYVQDVNSVRGYKHLAYPLWTVEATFDKTTEHGIYGYYVSIWGDIAEIYTHNEQGMLTYGR